MHQSENSGASFVIGALRADHTEQIHCQHHRFVKWVAGVFNANNKYNSSILLCKPIQVVTAYLKSKQFGLA